MTISVGRAEQAQPRREGFFARHRHKSTTHKEESRNLVGGAPFSSEVTAAVEQYQTGNRATTFVRDGKTYIRLPLGNGTFAEHEVK